MSAIPGDDPDAALVERAQAGDRAAFEELYRKYVRRVFNLVYRTVSDPSVTEDVTQEVFLQVYRNLPSFRGTSKFYTWLFRVAFNVALVHARRVGLQRARQLPFEDWHPSTAPHTRPDQAAEAREELSRVERALADLAPAHRSILVLGAIQEHSYREISRILGISVIAVKGRLHRAREALHAALRRPRPGAVAA